MKILVVVSVAMLLMLFSIPTKAQLNKDSTVIQNILHEEVTSWKSRNAVTYSKHIAEKGTFTNIRGSATSINSRINPNGKIVAC